MTSTRRPRRTIGILSPGEMGSALGAVLAGEGHRVATTLDSRSQRSCRRCTEAGLEVLPTADDVARTADVFFSVVPAAAAKAVARAWAKVAGDGKQRLYIDVNSVSPRTAAAIGRIVASAGGRFVDAAIHGLARYLRTRGIVYLSGAHADEVADLLRVPLQVRIVGTEPGQASAVKGALASLSKGLVALFTEAAVYARTAGSGEAFLEGCRLFYPGVLEAVHRLLPTYPQHAARRADEVNEQARAMRSLGLDPAMVRGAAHVLAAIAAAGLDDTDGPWTAASVVEALYQSCALELPQVRQR
jgi:3-hydroxyisobutyrate dehydrogenase-like beta-hydroxyacid dehydrogenase